MGRGKELLIDEWFFHHFEDENLSKDVTKLFVSIFEVCDKIILKRNTSLFSKFHAIAEKSINFPPKNRLQVKFIIRLFLQNSNKIAWIEEDIVIEKSITSSLHHKDLYLVKMCLQSNSKIYVTTDERLAQPLKEQYPNLGITVFSAQEFMNAYPNI